MPETSATRPANDPISRFAGRAAEWKWFFVFAAMLIATAVDGATTFVSNRDAAATASRLPAGAATASGSAADLVSEPLTTGSIDKTSPVPRTDIVPICFDEPSPLKS